MSTKNKFASFLIISAILTPILIVQAVAIQNPLTYNSFPELINRLIDFIMLLAIAVSPIMIIIAGFFFIMAAGDMTKIETAKKMIIWTLIGLLIVLMSKGIIALLIEVFNVKTT